MRFVWIFLLCLMSEVSGQNVIPTLYSIPSFISVYQNGECAEGLIAVDTTLCFDLSVEANSGGFIYVAFSSPQNGALNIAGITQYAESTIYYGDVIRNASSDSLDLIICFDLFNTYIDNFCPYYLPGLPLAVNFGEFTAVSQGNWVSFSWITMSEANSHLFEIQGTQDFQTWVTLGTKTAFGNSSVMRIHNQLTYIEKGGTWYARICEKDLDGESTFSEYVYFTITPEINKDSPLKGYDLAGRKVR